MLGEEDKRERRRSVCLWLYTILLHQWVCLPVRALARLRVYAISWSGGILPRLPLRDPLATHICRGPSSCIYRWPSQVSGGVGVGVGSASKVSIVIVTM